MMPISHYRPSKTVNHIQSLLLREFRSGQREVVSTDREVLNLGETESDHCSQVVFIHSLFLLRGSLYSIFDGRVLKWSL